MNMKMTLVLGILMTVMTGCVSLVNEQSVVPDVVEKETVIDVTGYWEGTLAISPTNSLSIGFIITPSEEGFLEATLQIPTQGLRDFKVSSIKIDKTLLTIEIEQLQASFTGTYDDETQQIEGTFLQMGQSLPLNLKLATLQEKTRPQDPIKPYPYISQDITFTQSPMGFLLAGTITKPQGNGPFPAVVLISGSGSQNRDEELMGHRPFLVLADALTRNGIVVLRYDDRGFAESKGDASSATSIDFADDAESAIEYLKTLSYVDTNNIGIIGHSEGAIIGPIVAHRNKDVRFLVLMAGSGVDGIAVLEDQTAAILRAQQVPETAIAQAVEANLRIYTIVLDESKTLDERKQAVLEILLSLGLSTEQATSQITALFSPWYMKFLTLNPATYLQDIDIPVMILNGTKDTQVSSSLHVPAIESALLSGGNSRYTTNVYEGLNHLFQPATTGAPDEYGNIEITIDPIVLQDISSWITKDRFQL